ncbi:MAG TPA: heat-inducible transcriptional repressor HrcA [Candidatus Polarisedimenticolaceae bacterium]|nr:heat-inducible transcriptional repressor HrcA [Candidatus Polarisedimenticolaceae bacterium]
MTSAALDERQAQVLRAVIEQHVQSGEPIGSRAVSLETRLGLSPASIRSVMAGLEDRGYLSQPHTSAGRVPTDKAYRFYVDHMVRRSGVTPQQAQAIDQALEPRRAELPEMLGAATHQLSQLTQQVGLVLAPELRRVVVDHIEFARIDPVRVVTVLVGRSGVVHHHIIEVPEPLDQDELTRIGRWISEQFGGRTLPEIRDLLRHRLSDEREAYDRLVAESLRLARQAVETAAEPEARVFVEGTAHLVASPDFADPETVRGLLTALEAKGRLVELLNRVLEEPGVQVVIGGENRLADLQRCSLVASAYYGAEGRVIGTLGVVGPTRMEYGRAIALVGYLARVLTRLLSEGGN